MKSTKKVKIFVIAIVFVGLLISFSVWIATSKCAEQYTADSGFADGIIESVSPPPNSKISFTCYTRKNMQNISQRFSLSDPHNHKRWVESGGINVKLQSTNELVKLESTHLESEQKERFEESVLLFVDDKNTLRTIFWSEQDAPLTADNYTELAGAYIFGTNIFLLPGNHKAKLVINTKSGEVLQYEWSFTVTWH